MHEIPGSLAAFATRELRGRGMEIRTNTRIDRVDESAVRLSTGEWDAGAALEVDSHHRGFMIVDGLMSRTVDVLGRRWLVAQSPVPFIADESATRAAEVTRELLGGSATAISIKTAASDAVMGNRNMGFPRGAVSGICTWSPARRSQACR